MTNTQPQTLASRIGELAPDERAILEKLLERLEAGRESYGFTTEAP